MTRTALESLRANSFERWSLRRNPFGELPRGERATLACVDTTETAAFLNAAGDRERRALQLVAGHGRGKSTHLIALHARDFPHAPFSKLHLSDAVPGAVPHERIHFVDSIENLSWLGRRKLYSQCPVLACTTHRDLSRELRRAGYHTHSLRVGIRSLDELRPIIAARIDAASLPAASLPGGSPPRPTLTRLEELYQAYGDDVRSIEHALYQDYERLRAGAPSTT